MSIVGTLNAENGNLISTLTDSDLLNPTLNGSYSDDYQLIDVTVGQLITISLTSNDYDTYLQLINADTEEVITGDDDGGEGTNSKLSFVAVEGINYVVRVSGYDETELGTYELSATNLADSGDGYGGDGYGGDGYGGDGYGGDGYGGGGEVETPNLNISDIISPSQAYTGNSINVSWTVENTGDIATSNTYWNDRVYLSTDETYDNDDRQLFTDYFFATPLAVGETYSKSWGFDLPDVAVGDYYLLFYTDRTNRIGEVDEADNISTAPIEILQSDVDLSISDVDIIDKAKPGQRITIDYTHKNNGSTPINSSWTDTIYLSTDEIIDDSDEIFVSLGTGSLIEAGETKNTRFYYNLPEVEIGDYYLIFETDDGNRLKESNEGNNITSTPIKIALPNLTVSDTSSPSEAVVNDTINVSWTVSNTGNDITTAYYWYDQVFLSSDANYDEDDTRLVYKNPGKAYPNIEPNSSYTSNAEISLPNTEAGDYYLIFYTDKDYRNYDSDQIESSEADNFTAVPISLSSPDVDLSITSATAPSTALVHSQINVSWKITNNGTDTINGGWYEGFYISDDEYLDENDTYADKAYNNKDKFIEPGSTRSLNFNVDVPNTKTGSRYLLFVADYDNRRSETDDSNNVYAVPIDITAPNLAVTSAEAPIAVNKGSEISADWKVENTGNQSALAYGWYDHIYLSTDENYDDEDRFLESFYRDNDYYLLAPGGTYAPHGDYYSDREFIIPNETVPGNYYLLFHADKHNRQGETNETDNVTALPIKVFDTTNIKITDVDAPSSATLDDKIEVSWTVSNAGLANASATWYDSIYLSEDEVFDDSDAYAGGYKYEADTIINAGDSFIATQEISIPEKLGTGERYLLFVTDTTNIVPESDETDNTFSVPISLTSTNLELTDATVPSSVSFYETLDLSWTVTNTGTGRASSYWYDEIYLSDDNNYDRNDIRIGDGYRHDGNTPLDSGASYEAIESVTIPNTVKFGSQYVLFVTDEDGYQAESDETDNVLALPIEVKAADLKITDTNVPTEVTLNQPFNVSWVIENSGEGTAFYYQPTYRWGQSYRTWNDSVYLSSDNIFDEDDDLLTYKYYDRNDGALNPGENYTVNNQITISAPIQGDYYLFFVSDRDLVHNETDETNNIKGVPINVKAPNFEVTGTTSSAVATSGERINLSMTVANTGDGAVFVDRDGWYHNVYISDDQILDNSDRSLWRYDINRNLNLAPDESYTIESTTERIPNDRIGNQYLLFVADKGKDRTESNEADNIAVVPIEIKAPNLTITDAIAPDWAGIGQTIPVSWTVTNNGEVATALPYYYDSIAYWDRIYLSSDSELDNGDTPVDSRLVDRENPLATKGSYTISQEITLPDSREGELYLLFATDTSNHQGETDETDNVRAVPIFITDNGVNLQVTDADAPESATLGETIAIDWTTTNVGGVSASLDWLDRVYLSDNPTWESTDIDLTEQTTGSLSPLAAGSSYDIAKNITIPLQGAGTRYLIFKADDESVQIETDDTDNTYVVPIEVLAPNLVLTDPTAPITAYLGELIELSWTVSNIGDVAALGSWREQVYISDDEYFDNSDVSLTYGDMASILEAGDEYTFTKDTNIPRTTIGDRYLLFVADRNNLQGETDETDNVVAIPIEITAKDVDLVVSNISAPIESYAGEEVEVVWTVTNNGSVVATGTWTDRIYLTSDPENIKVDEIYGSFEFTGTVAAGQSIERRQKITLPQTLEGDFSVVVKTDIYDSLIEYGAEDNNTTVREEQFTSILPTFPNLQVSNVTAPNTAFSSQSTVVEWTVTNTGNGATSAPRWLDSVWLSLDQNFDGSDIKLGQVANTSYLNAGESYSNSLEVTLPQGIDGNYYFLVQTDWGKNQVFEFQNEDDNLGVSNVSDIELTPPPDLQVSVNAPSNAFSSQYTSLSWTVTNEGTGRTLQSSWYDEVYLSADTVLDGSDEYLGRQNHRGILEPGESYTVNEINRLFKLPEGISGDYYFIVRTDAGGQVYESALAANNTGFEETPTNVFLTPPPDLEISVDAPDTGLASHDLTINYSVGNYGATPTPNGKWLDTFYLSVDDTLDASDIVLGSRTFYGSLDTGNYQDKSVVLTLPDGISGNYYLFAKTDSNDDVFELDNDNNTAFKTITIDSKPADLMVSEVTAPSMIEAGTGAKVSWTVTNQGTGDTVKTSWNDQLWLSNDSVVGNSDDRLLETFTHNVLLNAGESYTSDELVTIPFSLQGNYQLYIKTDANNSVYEASNEVNNISVFSPIAITRETPDLQVTAVNAPVAGASGESITVNWSVANSGTGKTNSNYWYDEVFLSLDRDLGDSSDISLGKVYHSGSLDRSESYDVARTFNLPQNLDEDYYVVVRTDTDYYTRRYSGDRVLEAFENNNELATSSKTSISLNSLPDLVIEEIDAPTEAISGQTFDLSWTVSNQGTDVNDSWRDVFYLSRDQVFDRSSDIYLGSSFHYGNLAAGAESSKTASFDIPRGLSGPFYVFGITDSGSDVYERSGENNNIAFDGNSMNVRLPPPADLAATAISLPTDGVPGENITLNYTVTNQGDYTLNGNWEDAIYLSEDDQWDINDPLIEKVRVFDSVDSGESYSRTVNASLPGVATGDYHVIVRSDIRNNVYESDENNNLQFSAEQININTELLELGGSDTDTIRPGRSIYYRIEANAGQAIRIKLDSQADNSSNNVYVRYEKMPTKGQFDFFTEPFSADPELVFPVEQDGTYYVLVTGDDSSVASNYTITAEEIPFSLLDVTTKKVGNVAPFTLELEGAKFDADNTIFQIVDEEGTVYESTQIVFKDSTTAYATFDLSGQSIGNYDVRAIQDGETIEVLEDVLIVEDGIDSELFSSIDGPGVVRPGGKYLTKLNYVNAGGADEAAPLIILQTSDTPLGLSSDSIKPTESLFLLGVGEDLGVDTLRPGEINQIPFFFSAGSSVNVNMLRYTEDSSTPITEADWNMIETAIKPAEVADEDWNEFWSPIQPRIGNTWGDYVRVVNDLAKAFSPEAERDYDVRELFAQWYESGDLSVYTPKSFVSGRLVDTVTGEPLSDAELQLYQEINGETIQNFHQVITNSEGEFSFATLPPGDYKLAVIGDYSFVDYSSPDYSASNNIYSLNIIPGNDVTSLSLKINSSPQIDAAYNNSFEASLDRDELFQNSLNEFESWIQEEINTYSSNHEQLYEFKSINPEIQNEDGELSEQNQENRYTLPSKVYNIPIIGKVKFKRKVYDEESGDIKKTFDGNIFAESRKIQEKNEISFPGLEQRFGISLPKIRYSTDGKKTIEFKQEDCEWRVDKHKLELGSSVLETKFKLETANSIVTLFLPEPLREAIVQFVVAGGDAFTTFSTNILSTSREFSRDAQTGEITIKDKWKPSFTIEQFFGKESNYGIKYGIFIKTKFDLEIVNGKTEKTAITYEYYFNLPYFGGRGFKTKIENKGGLLGIFNRSTTNILISPEEFSNIEIPSDQPIPLPPGDDDPLLPGGFTSSDFLQSPEKFFNSSEPPEIEECEDDPDDDGDLDDYNPAVLVSRDPNDILGPEGFGEENWIDAEEPLDYTIRFENDPELASAPAQVVKITQQLDEDLDFRTFRLGDFGFGDTFIDVPENRAFYQTRLDLVEEKGIYVDVFAGIDIATGEAFWELRSIDPETGEQPNDPLLGFLPPNLTKPEGDGFVSYSIRADRDIETGAVIDAEATIIFDINEPIDTPPIFNTIDVGKPDSTVNTLPDVSDSEEFSVSWSGSDDVNGSAIADYTIYVAENGGEITPWLENTTLTEAVFTGTPGSNYEFYAVARDNAGNIQDIPSTAQAVTTIAGGNNPPVLVNPIGTQIAAEDSNFSLTLTEDIFQDTDEGEVLTYSATLADGSDLPSWLSFDAETRTLSGTPLNEDVGNLSILVIATDNNGETTTDTFELEIVNVNDAPTLESALALQTATEDEAFSFTFREDTFNDIDPGDSLTYSATLADGSKLPDWLSFNVETRTFSGTPVNKDVGNLGVRVTATDNDGETVTDTFELEVINVNDAPTLEMAIANQTATEDEAFSFTFREDTFKDVDAGDSLTYTVNLADGSELPNWLTFNTETRTFSGISVNEDVGTLELKLTAIDNDGEIASNTFGLEVINVNDAPTLETEIANQTATEDEVFNFTLANDTFNDVDAGDSLTYTATLSNGSSLPTWLTFDAETRSFSGTPANENVDTISVKVTVTDKSGETATDTFDLEVINVNDTPTVESAIANQIATEDEEFNFTFNENTFKDVDAEDSLTYSATLADGSELPSWLTFNANTHTFNGTPVNEDVGTLSIKVIATDNDGESVGNTFNLEVINVNDAPILEKAIANQIATEDEEFNFTFREDTFNDIDAEDSLTYSATLADGSELPSWLTFDAVTRTFSGTPVNEDVSTLSIQLTATDNDGKAATDLFDLEVINVNDIPLDIELSNIIIDENSSKGTIIGNLSTLDPDVGDTFSYTLKNDASGRFILDGNDLQVASGNLLDFETNSSHSIEVQTTDSEGLSLTKNFTISLNDLNEAPITINDLLTANSSSAKTISIESLLSNDRDPEGNPLSLVSIDNAIRGTISLDDDSIIFTPDGTSNTGSFEYSVSDGVFTNTATVAIDVGVTVLGGKRSDTFSGTPGDDLIYGDSGEDTLNGGNGNDTLDGGKDNDLLLGGEGIDYLIGNSGEDTLDGGNGGDIYFALHDEFDLYFDTGSNGFDVIKATGRKDFDLELGLTFNKDNGIEQIDGTAISNQFEIRDGGKNNNVWDFSNVELVDVDLIDGKKGNDLIIGSAGSDLIYGDRGEDTINGGLGNDILDGGKDNDYLSGGIGDDTLSGGKGFDSFVFNSPNEGIDTITDFSVKDDTLVFSAAGFSGNLTVGMVKGEMFTVGTAATSNEHRFIYNVGSGDFFYDSDGTGDQEQTKIAQLNSGLSLGSDDLFIG